MNNNYIIFSNMGLLIKSNLQQVSQGNHNVDYYYIGYNGYNYESEYLTVGVTLPNGIEMPEFATSMRNFTFDGIEYHGFVFKLGEFLTSISGTMTMTFILKSMANDTELCSSQLNVVVHETDIPTDPQITDSQYNQLLDTMNEMYRDLNDRIESGGGTGGGGTSGTLNYNRLYNKPQINGVELSGNKTNEDIGIGTITNTELNDLLK